MATYDYKKLDVWVRSMDLVVEVYKIVKQLPVEERYALSDQLRRAVVSIPSNIAEGQKRSGRKETAQFTYIALGSNAEVETQLLIVNRLYNIDVDNVIKQSTIISRMLTALAKSLKDFS